MVFVKTYIDLSSIKVKKLFKELEERLAYSNSDDEKAIKEWVNKQTQVGLSIFESETLQFVKDNLSEINIDELKELIENKNKKP